MLIITGLTHIFNSDNSFSEEQIGWCQSKLIIQRQSEGFKTDVTARCLLGNCDLHISTRGLPGENNLSG